MTDDEPETRRLAAQMSSTAITFTEDGNPNHGGLPQWQPYGMEKRATMSFDVPSRLVDDPRGAERRLVEQVPYTQPGIWPCCYREA